MSLLEDQQKICEEDDIILARQKTRAMARTLGFRSIDQTRLATAVSEVTRNVLHYAGTGLLSLNGARNNSQISIDISVVDHGPGIPDIERAMTMGYSTSNGLGAGLPGAQRLVDQFHIQSKPGCTKIALSMKRKI
ncbi:anti-sigma regulatory factor [Magnetococcales bacterium HHB-1]